VNFGVCRLISRRYPYVLHATFKQLFCMIKQSEGDILDPGQSAEDNKAVEGYAHEFARNIPGREFSPAEIVTILPGRTQGLGSCSGGESAGMDG